MSVICESTAPKLKRAERQDEAVILYIFICVSLTAVRKLGHLFLDTPGGRTSSGYSN